MMQGAWLIIGRPWFRAFWEALGYGLSPWLTCSQS